MIISLTQEQEKKLRDLLIYDRVYKILHDTLCDMRTEMTDLSQVQIWLAAAKFTDCLLKLPDAEEQLPDEVEDLRKEARDKNDAVLIMTTSICQLSGLHKTEPMADDLIRWLLPHVMRNPIYRPLLESIDGKEQRMMAKGKSVDFDSYQLKEVEVDDSPSKEAERVIDSIVANLDRVDATAAQNQLLILNLINLQENHRYDKQMLKGFDKLKIKVDDHPTVNIQHGDYVVEKNVENEIGKVEKGGVGVKNEK